MDKIDLAVDATSREPLSQELIDFLLAPPDPKVEGDDDRPAKRRKTVPSRWSEVPDEPEWTDPILLARAAVLIDFPGPDLPDDVRAALNSTPKTVSVYSDTSRRRKHDASVVSAGGGSRRSRRVHYDRKRSTVRLVIESEGEELCEAHVPCEENDRTYRVLKAIAFHICAYFPKRSSLRCPVTLCYEPSSVGMKICVEMKILSRDAKSLTEASFEELESKVFGTLFPSNLHSTEEWVPQDFYDGVHVPSREDKAAEEAAALEVVGLECRLYPFQRRTVRWLLDREGVDTQSRTLDDAMNRSPQGDHGFVAALSVDGTTIFVNEWLGIVTSDRTLLQAPGTDCSGGLLAEEMGLGKTVEVVSLLLLHPRSAESLQMPSENGLVPTRATVIVSPISIQQQWKAEIEMHAPGLRVMIYEGLSGSKEDEEEHVAELIQYDVVLVSYNVLSKEVHYAMEGPKRALRHEKQYKKRKSPLVLIDWWRCVLDECQMIESGVSQAAQVANQIPRQNAWAVSGTPLKKDAGDLYGLLTFLRLEPYCYSLTLWKRLIMSYKPIFSNLFGHIALRHSKEGVKSELVLPPQKRIVMTLPFTSIEEQHYSNLFQEMCEDCDLSLEGAPLIDTWHPDRYIDKMRAWLSRLRQTVLHPEVGERNRRALGSSEGPLRTVAEVLMVMTEQDETATRTEERVYLTSKLRRGQILEHAKKTHDAVELWKDVLLQARKIVEECRKDRTLFTGVLETAGGQAGQLSNGNPVKKEENDALTARIGAWRMKLRGSLEVLHMATFFVANGYYQLKTNEEITKPESDEFKMLEKEETEMYEEAKRIRKEMLTETLTKADEYMTSIRSRKLVQVPGCEGPSVTGGIESRNVMERADDLCVALNRQAEKMQEWREKIIKFLLIPLIDQEDGELQGDEYETSTKQQDEVYVYMEALRAIEADRHDALTGQENILIAHEMRTNLRNAKNGEGHSPEVMIRLLQERDAAKPKAMFGSFRSILAELRSLRSNLERQGSTRATAEVGIVDRALTELQQQFETQTKTMTELERELDLFMSSSNSRLDFYRQLQTISDGVAPFEDEFTEESRERKLSEMKAAEAKSKAKIETLESRARYLSHLHGENNAQAEAKTCVICQEPIEIGVLTSCGHQFCKECLRQWWGAHRTCPVCKTKLNRSNFHQISYKPLELNVQEESGQRISDASSDSDSPPQSNTASIYSGISSATFAQIKNIDVHGSFGTKIDTLARHILYLRQTDPGAKSIVFSQFRDFLDILGLAFRRFKISYASVDEQRKASKHSGIERFKRDASVECFFLHAKAQAAGLNLVNATHVFLCEPLINTALELQAIARVHRIGQHRPTTVYMYLVDGTVERAIYDISVQRRLAHVGEVSKAAAQSPEAKPSKRRQDEDEDIDAANSLELREAALTRMLAAGRGGGELVPKSDVWACLFQSRGAVHPSAGQDASDEARKVLAGFLGGEAAEQRMVVGRK